MARPERPIAGSDPELVRLARWLRTRRRTAGLTHRDLVQRSGHAFSASTFSRAASGHRIPRLPVVEAYARACGAPVGEARRLWQAARYAEHRRRNPGAGVPRPDRVYDRDGLNHALQELYYKAGAMPVAEMERRAGRHGELPHSTVLRMLAGRSMLDLARLMAFLRVCDVTDGVEVERWRGAWRRARRRLDVERQGTRLARLHQASAPSRRGARDKNASGSAGGSVTHPRFLPYPHAALAGSWKQRTGEAARPTRT
ncbi:helix-turn-helix domain-containing protein [Streptomyces sp. NRRL S-920]|uniref:helix-turn-helix domain-containing protein n=1 Tax=Streptomyces sp. NRRL S-920 TaxID=1463921 RepID=UPI0004C54F97|nr:helix-turn-helix transcriptional regulator [Streptomyces sp. NRRL S-920]